MFSQDINDVFAHLKAWAKAGPQLWLASDLFILTDFIPPSRPSEQHSIQVKNTFSPSVQRKTLLTQTDIQYAPIHPCKREKSWIIYICSCAWEKWMRNMWQAVGWGRDTSVLFNTNTRVCWEITGGCSFRGRHKHSGKCYPPSYRCQFSPVRMCLGANGPGLRPVLTTSWSWLPQPASLSAEQKHQIAALQQTNPDRSSHLRFTLGQLWCHPTGVGGWGWGLRWGGRQSSV